MDLYGQFPGGGFAADENARPGFTDPHQGFETCGIVEFMHSFEMLTKNSGHPVWADRCEEVAFNSLPAALTPDWKGLHYLTCANQVLLDRNNHAPGVENSGRRHRSRTKYSVAVRNMPRSPVGHCQRGLEGADELRQHLIAVSPMDRQES